MAMQRTAIGKAAAIIIIAAIFLAGLLAGQFIDIRLKSGGTSQAVNSTATLTSTTTVTTTLIKTKQPTQGGILTPPQIFKKVEESVVSISVSIPGGRSQGSGFVFDEQGHIVTNNHVVDGATSITVTFLDGVSVEAKLVGSDVYSDLAVVKVDLNSRVLKPIPLGSSSELEVGEQVVAIGNPFGLSGSMTMGIVSQLGRESRTVGGYLIIDLIQIDAPINPGNSGGPLLNMKGEVVGVNTLIYSRSGAFEGVGLAIPSDTVKRVVPSIIATGQYKHPYVGVQGIDVTPKIAEAMGLDQAKGFLVMQVMKGGPADRAGLRGGTKQEVIEGQPVLLGGDVIIGVDGVDARKLYDLLLYIERNKRPGDTVTLKVIRGGQVLSISLTLG